MNPLQKFVKDSINNDIREDSISTQCSAGLYTYIGIDPFYRVCHKCVAQDDSNNTFVFVWEFSECPNTSCPSGCICNVCDGEGPWGDGPCYCVVYDANPNAADFTFHKIPIAVAWPHLDTREKLSVYEVDPGFVYTQIPDAHNWYFPAKKQANEEDGVYREKHSRRIRREKIGI